MTSPNVPPGPGRGPANSVSCFPSLTNASFTDIVNANSDTLYCLHRWISRMNQVLVVPPINDRYYSFQFLDAYTNNYDYLGQRAFWDASGTYLIAGPDWNGQVPEGMTKIWTPTNLAWLVNRILVKGPADVPNVNAIQGKIIVKPLLCSKQSLPRHHNHHQHSQCFKRNSNRPSALINSTYWYRNFWWNRRGNDW